eukprot:TRINITY_DN37480_c0_g1_i1.p1 TRINITY_DN37480_c0_g1~~TRINITY_DN37480_c0_g1_i1.p1  ORF type:complete len:565 (+),score=110.15 TRINITY_DN37480_c0_g1_i1:208-1695(+)
MFELVVFLDRNNEPADKPYSEVIAMRSTLAEACDPSRTTVMRDKDDGDSLRFHLDAHANGLVVDKDENGAWVQLAGPIVSIQYTHHAKQIHLKTENGTGIRVQFSHVVDASGSTSPSTEESEVLDRLSCYCVAAGIFNNLPAPPLFSKDTFKERIAEIVNYEPNLRRKCDPFENIQLQRAQWVWEKPVDDTTGISLMHNDNNVSGTFKFHAESPEQVEEWIRSLSNKQYLMIADPYIRMTEGSMESTWQDANMHPRKDDDDGVPTYVIIVAAAMIAAMLCILFIIWWHCRSRSSSPKDEADTSPEASPALPPKKLRKSKSRDIEGVSRELESRQTAGRDTNRNPIDELYRDSSGARRTPQITLPQRQPPPVSDPSLDRYGTETSLSNSYAVPPALAQARALHRQSNIQIVPGPGWESTHDGTLTNVESNMTITTPQQHTKQAIPAPYHYTGGGHDVDPKYYSQHQYYAQPYKQPHQQQHYSSWSPNSETESEYAQ